MSYFCPLLLKYKEIAPTPTQKVTAPTSDFDGSHWQKGFSSV